MTEPQDFESLDELFRKTFDGLPENASPSGWDRPSDRVWQHVQATIQPPKSGWSTKAITLVSALAVTIVVGLYLFVSRSSSPDTIPATSEEPVVTIPTPATTPAVAETTETVAEITTPNRPASVVSSRPKHLTPSLPIEKPEQENIRPAPQRPMGSAPLPGSQDDAPNTTVLNQGRMWQTPLQPLPVLPDRVDRQEK